MMQDYRSGMSFRKLGEVYRRTNQSLWETFKKRGLFIRHRRIGPKINYSGLVYTPSKRGAYRCTTLDRHWLHHRMWEDRTGRKVPAGCQVSFKNGDATDLRFENFLCAPASEVTSYHQRRLHPASSLLTPAERREQTRKNNLVRYYRTKAKWETHGLNSQGKLYKRRKNSGAYGTVGNPRKTRLSCPCDKTPLQALAEELRAEIERSKPQDVYA